MLGDSIAFGVGVGDDDTFSALLDSRENGLEVVNLAVQGYGLDQSLLKLEREGLALSPDVVVLNVCLSNDVADTVSPVFLYDGRYPKPHVEIEHGRLALRDGHLKLSMAARLGRELTRRSRLFAWLAARPGPAPDAEGGPVENWLDRRTRLEATPEAVQLCRLILARMRELVEARGARFIVLLHPDWDSYSRGSRWLEAIFRAPELDGVRVIDLRAHYLENGLKWRRLALDETGHLSPTGHRVVADIIEGELRAATTRRER
jgi:hypothetical protein